MNPYVKSVQPRDDYCLLLTFENGEKRIFDLKPYLNKGVFTRLKNTALFKAARVVSGSVEWHGEIDLSYDTLYLESVPAKSKSKRSKTRKKKLTPLPTKRVKQEKAKRTYYPLRYVPTLIELLHPDNSAAWPLRPDISPTTALQLTPPAKSPYPTHTPRVTQPVSEFLLLVSASMFSHRYGHTSRTDAHS